LKSPMEAVLGCCTLAPTQFYVLLWNDRELGFSIMASLSRPDTAPNGTGVCSLLWQRAGRSPSLTTRLSCSGRHRFRVSQCRNVTAPTKLQINRTIRRRHAITAAMQRHERRLLALELILFCCQLPVVGEGGKGHIYFSHLGASEHGGGRRCGCRGMERADGSAVGGS